MFLSNLNFSLFFTSLLTTLLITFLAKPFFLRLGLVDIPNPRSNHNFPVALGGGIIITLLILSLGLYSKISFSFTCYSVFIMLFAISLLDDLPQPCYTNASWWIISDHVVSVRSWHVIWFPFMSYHAISCNILWWSTL